MTETQLQLLSQHSYINPTINLSMLELAAFASTFLFNTHHLHNLRVPCCCRLGHLDEVCAFASPASRASTGKFGFTPMSAHYRPLMGHEAAQVIMTMQTLPNKATVVIGMLAPRLLCPHVFAA